jgi:hypothetical protein
MGSIAPAKIRNRRLMDMRLLRSVFGFIAFLMLSHLGTMGWAQGKKADSLAELDRE